MVDSQSSPEQQAPDRRRRLEGMTDSLAGWLAGGLTRPIREFSPRILSER